MALPSTIVEIASVFVFFLAYYMLITGRNVIRSIVAISLMETAAVVFFLGFGFRDGMQAPIGADMAFVADPLPQALVITAIIMGVAVSAICVTMLLTLYKQSGGTDWDDVMGAAVSSDSQRGV